jgi:hypothetical protein
MAIEGNQDASYHTFRRVEPLEAPDPAIVTTRLLDFPPESTFVHSTVHLTCTYNKTTNMKIIITGCTGLVGSEVTRLAIKHQYIDHIYAVTRKPLDPEIADHPKVTQIIHEDFETWPDHLLRLFEHEGVRGCIWYDFLVFSSPTPFPSSTTQQDKIRTES